MCHAEKKERVRQAEREGLAPCPPSLVASVIATAGHLHRSASEKVRHLGRFGVQILAHSKYTHTAHRASSPQSPFILSMSDKWNRSQLLMKHHILIAAIEVPEYQHYAHYAVFLSENVLTAAVAVTPAARPHPLNCGLTLLTT